MLWSPADVTDGFPDKFKLTRDEHKARLLKGKFQKNTQGHRELHRGLVITGKRGTGSVNIGISSVFTHINVKTCDSMF